MPLLTTWYNANVFKFAVRKGATFLRVEVSAYFCFGWTIFVHFKQGWNLLLLTALSYWFVPSLQMYVR